MFSYQQISRWLPFVVDPVTIEDWLANRELFGSSAEKNPSEEEKALELAYLTEKVREKQSDVPTKDLPLQVLLSGMEVNGIVELDDVLLIAPSGKSRPKKGGMEIELILGSEKVNKINLVGYDLLVITIDPSHEIKLKVKCKEDLKIGGKSEASWQGSGKSKLVFDTRGRPIGQVPVELAHEFAIKVKQQQL